MSKGINWARVHNAARIWRQGTEGHKLKDEPLFPSTARHRRYRRQPSKQELRMQAEAALRAWKVAP
jgi:hypothetical protein